MGLRRAFCSLLGLIAFVGSGAARATELDWNAPSDCSEHEFTRQLESSAERSLEELSAERVEVRVTREDDQAWRAGFSLVGPDGSRSPERTIDGRSCEDVSQATAVAVAIALYPPEDERIARAEPVSSPSQERSPPAAISTEASQESRARSAQLRPRPFFSLGLLGDTDTLGAPSFGGLVGGGIGLDSFELGLGGGVLAPTSLRVSDTVGIQVNGYLTQVFGCYVARTWSAMPRLCLAYDIDVVVGQGTGEGLSVARRQTAFFHALTPELGVAFPLARHWEFRILAGVSLGLNRVSFVVDDGEVAYELPPFSMRGLMGIAWQL